MSQLESMLSFYGISYRAGVAMNQGIRCPVHEDVVASASLNLNLALWNCHACGTGGSVFDLVMHKEGVDYATAKRFIEGIAGGSDSDVRRGPERSPAVPPGQGYRPRNRRKVPVRFRQQSNRWT